MTSEESTASHAVDADVPMISTLPPAIRLVLAEGEWRGAMRPEQLQRALDWLNDKWTNKDCPFHGATNWGLNVALVEVRTLDPNLDPGGSAAYPLVMATCATCGFTVFLNAAKAGVVAPLLPDPVAGEQEGEQT